VEDELPDWLKEAQKEPEPLAFEELEGVGEAEQAVEEISAEEDLPDWLREVEIEEAEPFEPSEPSPELLTEGLVEETLVIEDELPDWLQEVQDELPEEVTADQEIPALATTSVLAGDSAANLIDEEGLPDWLKDVEEEPEAALEEEPLPPAEPVMVPSGELASPLPAPIAEVEEIVESIEISPVPALPALETTPAVMPATSDSIPDWLQKLREVSPDEEQAPVLETRAIPQPVLAQAGPEPEPDLPADAEERLKLARTARDKGQMDEAVRIYDSLISRGVYLDKIIADMQQSIKSHPKNYLLFQVMGDAMMKDGRLQSALNAYREALSRL
jgi:tetratricopeptide (TPR) repeat protein